MQSVSSVPDWAAQRDRRVALHWFALIGRVKLGFSFVRTTSTGSRQVLKAQEEFNGEENWILDLLGKGLSRDFPNPQRVGCPDSALLRRIALRKVPLSEADRWLNHFSSCSPCFQEFTQFRKQAVERRRTQVWLTATAVFILAVAGWLWVRNRPPLHTSATAVLDLRERSLARGENPKGANQVDMEIPRTARRLIVDLPIGSKEGRYDLALLNEAGDEVLRATGTATLEDHVLILRAEIDIRNLSPGIYFIGLRQLGPEWNRYPTRVN
jgi:hypothetical protein